MNKTELIAYLMNEANLTKVQATAAVDAFIEGVVSTLKKGDKVTIPGFGVFSVKERAARDGINPLTKEKIKIKASKSAGFKPSKTLKDALN
ncbi:MAG: HU family DNA-binding protein [Bacilli bacterium]|jgi:DNA-binding protein HU-beta|nr:HU family DNA-binding protein [Bacilli bacterium]